MFSALELALAFRFLAKQIFKTFRRRFVVDFKQQNRGFLLKTNRNCLCNFFFLAKSKYSTFHERINTMVPFKIEPLFQGGTFDKDYNTKYQPITFIPPSDCARIKLVAVITGHGSDNNNCAEFCVTSHHFVVNSQYNNTRVFKNAGTALGCAERVREGVVPNEHGTWLYGRDGWCDGQEVVPWVIDILEQVTLGRNNTITYHGWFNGTDPNPSRDPGQILMYSYLVYYKYLKPSSSE